MTSVVRRRLDQRARPTSSAKTRRPRDSGDKRRVAMEGLVELVEGFSRVAGNCSIKNMGGQWKVIGTNAEYYGICV